MTKTVYTGREVPHIFATQSQSEARNNGGSLFFDGPTLYSYRRSAPLAHFVRPDFVLINGDSYSVTTSKHQSWTHYALHHITSLTVPDLRQVIENNGESMLCEYIAKRAKEIDALREKANRIRSDWKKADNARQIESLERACEYVWNEKLGKKTPWQSALAVVAKADKAARIRRYTQARNQLESGLETAERMLSDCREQMARDVESGRTHGLQLWWRLDNCAADIRRTDDMGANRGLTLGVTATFADAAKITGKKWAKECTALALAIHNFADALQPEIDASRVEYDKAEKLANIESVEKWLSLESDHIASFGETLCRVKGDTVETSRGARVALTEAIKATRIAIACRNTGKPYVARDAVGQYTLTKVTAEGDLHIGCHVIKWPAIRDCVARFRPELFEGFTI